MIEWLLAAGGPFLAKAGAALAALIALMTVSWQAGSRSMRREAEREAARKQLASREKADAASADYRADGAAGRLRTGRF